MEGDLLVLFLGLSIGPPLEIFLPIPLIVNVKFVEKNRVKFDNHNTNRSFFKKLLE